MRAGVINELLTMNTFRSLFGSIRTCVKPSQSSSPEPM